MPRRPPGGRKAAAAGDDGSGGARPPLPRDTGYLLHAWSVQLRHPASGEELTLHAPPPAALSLDGELTLERWTEQNPGRVLALASG